MALVSATWALQSVFQVRDVLNFWFQILPTCLHLEKNRVYTPCWAVVARAEAGGSLKSRPTFLQNGDQHKSFLLQAPLTEGISVIKTKSKNESKEQKRW